MDRMEKSNSIMEMKWDNNFAYVLEDEQQFMATEFNMCKKMRNSCFLKCMKTLYNGKIQLYYLPESYKSFHEVRSEMLPDNLLFVIMNLVKNIIDIKGTGILSCNSINLSMDKIFIDMNTYAVKVVYVPSTVRPFENGERFEKYFRESFARQIEEDCVMKSSKLECLAKDLRNIGLTLNDIYDKIKKDYIKTADETEKTVKAYAKLVPTNSSEHQVIVITKEDFVIGKKASEVDGLITNDKMISRVHCKIMKKDEQLWIMDLLSANGTFVNQARIKSNQVYPIKNGDMIQLADRSFKLVME